MQGCAIVTYATPEEAATAISTLSGSELSGRKVLVREDREGADGAKARAPGVPGGRSAPRGGRGRGAPVVPRAAGIAVAGPATSRSFAPGTSLFVGNLAWSVGWAELKDAFAAYKASYTDVKYNADGSSKGWGIVRFDDPADAAAALKGKPDILLACHSCHTCVHVFTAALQT
jgi:RNA recognition motif-containing protein